MRYEEAKAKIKSLLMAEIDKLPSHYDSEAEEEVYSNTAKVDEILVLNKTICEALEKQIPMRPIEYEDKFYACPVCGNPLLHKWEEYPAKLMSKDKGLPYCLGCGQQIDWSDDDD